MAKPSQTEDALAKIHAIRSAPQDYDLKRDLAPFLRHKSNHVVAAAAAVVESTEDAALAPELVTAWMALFPKAVKNDPGCKALTAIAKALAAMGEDASEVYLVGISYVQKEGSFGPPVDVAAPLRGLCARGLVRMRHSEALYKAVDLLADPETAARTGAVEALSDSQSRETELVLRMKALAGDREEEVMAACLSALMEVAPSRSLEFVARFLRPHCSDEQVEAAALALGEARPEGALAHLTRAWEAHRKESVRRVILLSIGLLRQPEAAEFLLEKLKQVSPSLIPAVRDALALYRTDVSVAERMQAIITSRNTN